MDPASAPAVVTDNNPVPCHNFNVWDESIGWVDLNTNDYWLEYDGSDWMFPGRLVMWVVGVPGGGGSDPEPQLSFVSPHPDNTCFGSLDLWAAETAGSGAIDYVVFEYAEGPGYVEIGRDFDGASPLRDGASSVQANTGFSLNWDFSGLGEGSRKLRATVVDTLGQSSADSVTVYLEPTPPRPEFTSHTNGQDFCGEQAIDLSCFDENLSYVELKLKQASPSYAAGVGTFTVAGQGTHLVGPAAAALAVKLLYDRGYADLMKEGLRIYSLTEMVNVFDTTFDAADNGGSYDENVVLGLNSYYHNKGDILEIGYQRNPTYYDIRRAVEDEEQAAIIALSGDPGTWLTISGFSGWPGDGAYYLSVSDPLTGTIRNVEIADVYGGSTVNYEGTWQKIDLMVTMLPEGHSVTRSTIGADFNSGDGWGVNWTPSGLTPDGLYFLRAVGTDATGLSASSTVLMRYACTQTTVPGDYNDDAQANLADLYYLVNFITSGGPEPVGGPERADANGDGYVNLADVVYYINYSFGSGSPPVN
jgi:hypothetical protein